MNETGNTGAVRVNDYADDGDAKEELKRQVEETRDAVAHTVSEIGNVVMDQVEAVKETLDWREHVKKNPVAWSVGALGTGCLVGYVATSAFKPHHHPHGNGHSAHPPANYEIPDLPAKKTTARRSKPAVPSAPTMMDRFKHTAAYGRIREEATSVGNNLLGEVSNVAKEVLLPAAIGTLTTWLSKWVHAPEKEVRTG